MFFNFPSLINATDKKLARIIGTNSLEKVLDRQYRPVKQLLTLSGTNADKHASSRYIRHEIDMIYYLAPGEQEEMEERVVTTVAAAAKFISERISSE